MTSQKTPSTPGPPRMSRRTRWFLGLLVGLPLLFVLTLGAGVAAAYRSGTIEVEIEEQDGGEIHVQVPAVLARMAIAVTPMSALEEALVEVDPWIEAIRAGWDEFQACPDFVLVEYDSRNEHVRIEKSGGRLLVHVDEDGSTVRVSVPMTTVGSLLARLDLAAGVG